MPKMSATSQSKWNHYKMLLNYSMQTGFGLQHFRRILFILFSHAWYLLPTILAVVLNLSFETTMIRDNYFCISSAWFYNKCKELLTNFLNLLLLVATWRTNRAFDKNISKTVVRIIPHILKYKSINFIITANSFYFF